MLQVCWAQMQKAHKIDNLAHLRPGRMGHMPSQIKKRKKRKKNIIII